MFWLNWKEIFIFDFSFRRKYFSRKYFSLRKFVIFESHLLLLETFTKFTFAKSLFFISKSYYLVLFYLMIIKCRNLLACLILHSIAKFYKVMLFCISSIFNSFLHYIISFRDSNINSSLAPNLILMTKFRLIKKQTILRFSHLLQLPEHILYLNLQV